MAQKGSVLNQRWSDNLLWEFYLGGYQPEVPLCSAVYCLAIVKGTGQVVLTRMERGWEMLGGHIEPGETIQRALLREALEEGGFRPQAVAQFGYGKITASQPEPDRSGGYYPQTAYIPYFLAESSLPLLEPTGEETLGSNAFNPEEIAALNTNHEQLIRLGLKKYNSGRPSWTKIF